MVCELSRAKLPISSSQQKLYVFIMQGYIISLDFFDVLPEAYGIDEGGVGSPGSDEEGVVVPPLDFELTGEQLRELQAAVHPLSDSEEFGIDLYIRTLEFLEAIAN